MKRSYLIAAILALAAAGWVVSGQLDQGAGPKAARKAPADLATTQAVHIRGQQLDLRCTQATLPGRHGPLHTVLDDVAYARELLYVTRGTRNIGNGPDGVGQTGRTDRGHAGTFLGVAVVATTGLTLEDL